MKKILFSFFVLAGVFVLLSQNFLASANQVGNPKYVLPAFRALYSQGYVEGGTVLHLQPLFVDINGDSLLDMIISANTLEPTLANYPERYPVSGYLLAYVHDTVRNNRWVQEVRLNTGNGFRLVSSCIYTTQEQYNANCL